MLVAFCSCSPSCPIFSVFTHIILVIERQVMDRIEEELLSGFDENGETFEFAGPWLKRPADLDKLDHDLNPLSPGHRGQR